MKEVVGRRALEAAKLIPANNSFLPTIYCFRTVLRLHNLENPEWFKKERFLRGQYKGELKVKLRYKRLDTDNRIKFLKDWCTKCIGLDDDSIIFEDVVQKKQIPSSQAEHVEVHIRILDRDEFLPPAPTDLEEVT